MSDEYKLGEEESNESKSAGASSSLEIFSDKNTARVSDIITKLINIEINEEETICYLLQKALKYSNMEESFTLSKKKTFFLIQLYKSTKIDDIQLMILQLIYNSFSRNKDLIIEALFVEIMDIFYGLFQNNLNHDILCDQFVLVLNILSLFKSQYAQIIFSDEFFLKLLAIYDLRDDVTCACLDFMAIFSGEQPLNQKEFNVFNKMLKCVNEDSMYHVSKIIQHLIEFSQAQKFGKKFNEILIHFININKGQDELIKPIMIGLSKIHSRDSNLFLIPEVRELVADVLANTDSVACPPCLEALYNFIIIDQECCISTFFQSDFDLTPLLLKYLEVAKFNSKFAASMILFKLMSEFPDVFIGMLVAYIKDKDETFLMVIDGLKAAFQRESPIMLAQMCNAFGSLCAAAQSNGLFNDIFRILDETQFIDEIREFEYPLADIEERFDEIRRTFFDDEV